MFKAELVYTKGRGFNVLRPTDDDGVVRQNTLDLVAGLDFTVAESTRVNLQAFNRTFFEHDPDIVMGRIGEGVQAIRRAPVHRCVADVQDWLPALRTARL